MKIGLHIVTWDWAGGASSIGPTLAAIGDAAETAGLTDMSVMDHWFQMEALAPATEPMMEGYTTLGFLAAHTETIRLGLLVTGVTYRYPALLAKTVATVDVLSGGRGQLGIGAAWYQREHEGLGVPFPPVAERFELLEETIQVCFRMWSDDDGPFATKHFTLAETICNPRPISIPRPPVLIGGSGERKTLRLVAKYADACNLFWSSVEEVAHKLDVLRMHCDAEGRDYDTITKTMLSRSDPADPDAVVDALRDYAKLGIDTVIFVPSGDPVAFTQRLGGELAARLEEL
ncbi:MAG TPA: LLM class F420-dependent oxidoreductase [Acidimicrobiia bacterium]|jgi:F420-dependent oxidoreductase-like protein|nr:LLM class F420-dependent oxidoreductase [Acidimicrobiia bacterium]